MPQTSTDHSLQARDDSALQFKIEQLTAALDQILHACPAGLTEYALLRMLEAPEWAIVEPVVFQDPTKLYPVHFLVFHALYRLRRDLFATRGEVLTISVLGINLRLKGPAETAMPEQQDPMESYYLNLDNLHLGADEISAMLTNFWRGAQPLRQDQLEDACHTLTIPYPPDEIASANLQFRRLAMAHHPDRGGDSARLQRINQAIAIVRQYFRSRV